MPHLGPIYISVIKVSQTFAASQISGTVRLVTAVPKVFHVHKMASLKEDLARVFGEIDKDKSGFIDQKELRADLKNCGYNLTDAETNVR